MTRPCPACLEPLHVEVTDEGEVHRCPSCQGIWIAAAELHRRARPAAAVTTVGGLDVHDVDVADARSCPMCARPLRTARDANSGVQVDWCDRDGVWLDHLELERIMGELPDKQGHGWRGRLADIFDVVSIITP